MTMRPPLVLVGLMLVSAVFVSVGCRRHVTRAVSGVNITVSAVSGTSLQGGLVNAPAGRLLQEITFKIDAPQDQWDKLVAHADIQLFDSSGGKLDGPALVRDEPGQKARVLLYSLEGKNAAKSLTLHSVRFDL